MGGTRYQGLEVRHDAAATGDVVEGRLGGDRSDGGGAGHCWVLWEWAVGRDGGRPWGGGVRVGGGRAPGGAGASAGAGATASGSGGGGGSLTAAQAVRQAAAQAQKATSYSADVS